MKINNKTIGWGITVIFWILSIYLYSTTDGSSYIIQAITLLGIWSLLLSILITLIGLITDEIKFEFEFFKKKEKEKE